MTESAGSYAGTYYYHFDGLGSVVGLTNSSGNTVEVYEYDVYGRLGATDASHPNRILFTGREYDKETGLYYYRARYYNPQIGRFLQTDPVGYEAGMNLYRYCGNNPIGLRDPSGRTEELSLVPDVCDVECVEWTGEFEIRRDDLQPGGRKFVESIKKGAAEMKWVLRIAGLGTFILPSPGASVEIGGGQGDLTVLGAAAKRILSIIDSCDIPGYYRAYIKLKGHRTNGKTFITGKTKYKCVWTKWVEVNGSGGFNGIGYDTWEEAYKAIHAAAVAYTKPRPGQEIAVMTDEGLVEIVGEENNDG
jgi:RHS repeat-associated protein